MKSTQFELKEKNGTAFILAYGKEFRNCRFWFSTGEKVDGNFSPSKPGTQLKTYLQTAEKALQSLHDEKQTVTNETLKHRIELIRDRLAWTGNDLHIWDGFKAKVYKINGGVNKSQLEKNLRSELIKAAPDFHRVITCANSDGGSELFGFWQLILNGTVKTKKGKALRPKTILSKTSNRDLVKEFAPDATFESMDMLFYDTFTKWLEDKKSYEGNTVGKVIKDLKSVLTLARERDLFKSDIYKSWIVIKEKNEVIALTKEELLTINSLQAIDGQELTKAQKAVRDNFILASFLGPRIGDYSAFIPENISVRAGITFFKYVQEKTGALCEIPVHPIALQVLARNGGNFPKMYNDDHFRKTLKKICEGAGLTDRVLVRIREGVGEYEKKFEAISSHTARRTFATSLYYGWFTKPIPASLCMRYTGHTNETSFRRYVGASEDELNGRALEYFTDYKPLMQVG